VSEINGKWVNENTSIQKGKYAQTELPTERHLEKKFFHRNIEWRDIQKG
jgi:hypothetical protein